MRLTIEGTQDEIIALVRELGEAPEVLLTNAGNITLPPWLGGSAKQDIEPEKSESPVLPTSDTTSVTDEEVSK